MRRARYTAIFEPVRARWIGPTVSVSCAVLVLAACGCEPAEPATTPAIEPPPARRGGVIEGVVRLAEGAELVRLPDNPVQPSGRPPLPDVCAPP
ncbi:MAG: hypothetical protein IT378_02200, partial [Sandaracinaceae bacterium]|nr:hypothetical protein [Sandaracinaceae bacterium]